MAAHLPGVIAAMTPVPVIGVPVKASLDGMDALLAIVQMPPGIPVATVAIDGALNAGILAAQMIATGDMAIMEKLIAYKESLKKKIVQANEELGVVKYKFKTN
jgi:5-(carboxyamino)imidazole ribonucleotide mutase